MTERRRLLRLAIWAVLSMSLPAVPAVATEVAMPAGPGGTTLPTLVFAGISPLGPGQYDTGAAGGVTHERLVPYPSALIPYPAVQNRFGPGQGYATLVAAFDMTGTWHQAEVTAVWRSAQGDVIAVNRATLSQINSPTTWVWYISRRLDTFGSNVYHVEVHLANEPYRERARSAGTRETLNVARLTFAVRM